MCRTMFVMVVGVAALVGATESKAHPVAGRVVVRDTVLVGKVDCWPVALYGNEPTRIRISGDGDTCLELRVYDENGNLIGSDTRGMGDDREVRIRPFWTGKFTVKIRNVGMVHNHYVMVID